MDLCPLPAGYPCELHLKRTLFSYRHLVSIITSFISFSFSILAMTSVTKTALLNADNFTAYIIGNHHSVFISTASCTTPRISPGNKVAYLFTGLKSHFYFCLYWQRYSFNGAAGYFSYLPKALNTVKYTAYDARASSNAERHIAVTSSPGPPEVSYIPALAKSSLSPEFTDKTCLLTFTTSNIFACFIPFATMRGPDTLTIVPLFI